MPQQTTTKKTKAASHVATDIPGIIPSHEGHSEELASDGSLISGSPSGLTGDLPLDKKVVSWRDDYLKIAQGLRFPAAKAPHTDDTALFIKYQATKVLDPVTGKLQSSDKRIRNMLAERNTKLVTYVVSKFYGRKQEHKEMREDLLQEGQLGLFSAIDGFKPELGFKFSTYACWWVRQAINNYILDQKPHLHVPSHVRTAQNTVMRQLRELGMSVKDIREEDLESFGITEKMLGCINASLKSKWISSTDEKVRAYGDSDGTMTVGDSIPSSLLGVDQLMDYGSLITCAKEALRALPVRERLVVLLRYNIIQEVPVKAESNVL